MQKHRCIHDNVPHTLLTTVTSSIPQPPVHLKANAEQTHNKQHCPAEAQHTANRGPLHYAFTEVADSRERSENHRVHAQHRAHTKKRKSCPFKRTRKLCIHCKQRTPTTARHFTSATILHRLHGRKKRKFDLRTLIQTYFQA
jgi:hypothetical protein